jgi:hypothetical protein
MPTMLHMYCNKCKPNTSMYIGFLENSNSQSDPVCSVNLWMDNKQMKMLRCDSALLNDTSIILKDWTTIFGDVNPLPRQNTVVQYLAFSRRYYICIPIISTLLILIPHPSFAHNTLPGKISFLPHFISESSVLIHTYTYTVDGQRNVGKPFRWKSLLYH